MMERGQHPISGAVLIIRTLDISNLDGTIRGPVTWFYSPECKNLGWQNPPRDPPVRSSDTDGLSSPPAAGAVSFDTRGGELGQSKHRAGRGLYGWLALNEIGACGGHFLKEVSRITWGFMGDRRMGLLVSDNAP
jgi:hypothetical protein